MIALKIVVENSGNSSIPDKVYIFGEKSTQPKATYRVFSSTGSAQILGFYGYADEKGIKAIGEISVDTKCVIGWPKLIADPLSTYTIYYSWQQSLKEVIYRFVIIVIIMVFVIFVTLMAAVYMKCVLRQQQKKKELENMKIQQKIVK